MGMMDDMKKKMSDMGDKMDMDSLRSRYEELRRKDENGQADENERSELSQIRSKLGM